MPPVMLAGFGWQCRKSPRDVRYRLVGTSLASALLAPGVCIHPYHTHALTQNSVPPPGSPPLRQHLPRGVLDTTVAA